MFTAFNSYFLTHLTLSEKMQWMVYLWKVLWPESTLGSFQSCVDKALVPLVSEQEAVRAHPALSRRLGRDLLRPLSAYIPLCPRGSQHPRQSDPFCYRSKCPFNKQLVLLLPKMIPKLHPSCSQRLQVLLNMTLAGNFHSWDTFAWLMEQLRLGLRSRSVRLRRAADLHPGQVILLQTVNDTVLQVWDI